MKQSRHALFMLIEKYRAVMQKTWWKNFGADGGGLHRCRKGVCAAALLVSLAVGPDLAAAAETINYDGTDPSLLKPEPIASIPNSLFPSSVTGNIVTVAGDTVPGLVYGGVANIANTSVTNNTVNIGGGTVNGHVYGGLSWQGSADSNSVNITGGIVHSYVYGGYSNNSTANGNTVTISNGTVNGRVEGGHSSNDATNNSVTISGGQVGSDVIGGYSYSGAAATNAVSITSGTVNNKVYGGRAYNANASGNTVTIGGGTVKNNVYGGDGDTDATNNTVNMSNGSVWVDVYGGYARSGTASSNSVTISGGQVDGAVFGGYAEDSDASNNSVTINGGSFSSSIFGGNSDDGTASGNTVNITGGTIDLWVYGGSGNNVTGNTVNISGGTFGSNSIIFAGGGNTVTPTVTGNTLTISGNPDLANASLFGTNRGSWQTDGNTLNVKNSGMTAKAVAHFQYYNFYLPPTMTANETMLSVTNAADITGATIGVAINGGTTALRPGDRVTLLATGGLTADGINSRAVGLQGIARIYDFDLTTDANNLYATASGSPMLNPQTKALSEGQISAAAFLNQGADILSGQGLQNAQSAAAGAGGQTGGFAAMGGSSLRYETGSHVDVNGFSLVLGVARQIAATDSTRLSGLFLESGWGSYSTYNDFVNASSVRGDGNTRYFGAGWLGRYQQNNGRYMEGSLRFGKVYNKFDSNDIGTAGTNSRFDISAPYYGMHIGFGKEKDFGNNRKQDVYTKLLWTHQNGSNAIVQGDVFDFGAINSYRWQLGTKWLRKTNERTTLRTGLAYQYEFSGKANATVNGSAIEVPSMKGGTGIVEVGLTQESKDGEGAKLDFGLQGFLGKLQGVAGNIQATWNF